MLSYTGLHSSRSLTKAQAEPIYKQLWTPRGAAGAAPSATPCAAAAADRGANLRCCYTTRPVSYADQQRALSRLTPEDRIAELVVSNSRRLSQLSRRCGEEAAVDALLMERPLLLQLDQLDNWLQFLSAYGVRDADTVKLLVAHPELFERSDVHRAGLVILYFKQLVRKPCFFCRMGASHAAALMWQHMLCLHVAA